MSHIALLGCVFCGAIDLSLRCIEATEILFLHSCSTICQYLYTQLHTYESEESFILKNLSAWFF